MAVELKGRRVSRTVDAAADDTILQLALKHDVDWGFNCTRGTCARCRCRIDSGMERLNAPTEAELDRLEPEELESGFRLACQAAVKAEGTITAVWKPYF
ncbi:MAG: (2Fe-2S)-binding protein [Paenibacillaceae bacterium]|nr:(2Fe-2S)-binding protein [Paenibacillaceae bacterium]